MAKHDEISSTEKLLNVIRDKGDKRIDPPENETSQTDSAQSGTSLVKKISFKKKFTVGVDIGSNGLKLVAVSQAGGKMPELLNYAGIPFEPALKKDSLQFSRFLKSTLSDFCGSPKKAKIWSIISSARVETRYIRVPKVSSRQIANAVYWTYKKEVTFNDNSDIFDFEVLGDVVEDNVRKLEVIAYSAPRQEIQELKNIFLKVGYPLTGVSIVPFAMQNFLRSQWMESDAKNICNLFIGKDWSRIVIFSGGNLILSREIKSGIQSMVEAIRENIGRTGTEPTEEEFVEEGADEKISYSGIEKARHVFDRFVNENKLTVSETETGSGEEEIFNMITPALERIVRQVERTLEHYALNYKGEAVGKVFISGETSANKRILDYIGSQLELPIETMDPFAFNMSFSDHITSPETESERGSFTPAMGIALSDNTLTPNFIHTYKDKEEIATAANFNRAAFMAAIILIAVCFGTYYWQSRLIALKEVRKNQLQGQVDRYIPYVDESILVQMVTQVKQNRHVLDLSARNYSGPALITIISENTPENIRLLNLTADFGDISAVNMGKDTRKDKDRKKAKSIASDKNKKIQKKLILEGVISGDRLTFESSLAGYLVRLNKAPIFGQARVLKRSIESFGDQEVMKFTAQLELV